MTPAKKEKSEEPTDLITQTTKVLGIFGGGAILFYAIGFTIVKTYISAIHLDGMIWFTREFYVDAGASFLLEIIQAPFLKPLIFLPYVFVLYLLVPKKSLKPKSVMEAVLGRTQIIKLSIISIVFVGTLAFLYLYESILSGEFTIDPTARVEYLTIRYFFVMGDAKLVFFTFTTPLAIVLGVFLYRFRGLLKGAKVDRMIHQGAIVVYVAYLMYLPIFYGRYIYDWQLVELKDTEIVERILSDGEAVATIDFGIPALNNILNAIYSERVSRKIWLLGEFGDNYYFLTREEPYGEGVIEIIDTEILKRLNLDPRKKVSLRDQIGTKKRLRPVSKTELSKKETEQREGGSQ